MNASSQFSLRSSSIRCRPYSDKVARLSAGDLTSYMGRTAYLPASVADAAASEEFTEAEHNASVLQQVRDALGRVADGTFGTCIVDGGPIEEARLEAVPWTPYCLKHAQRLEVAASPSTPTL